MLGAAAPHTEQNTIENNQQSHVRFILQALHIPDVKH
jgi:hypothetical protein